MSSPSIRVIVLQMEFKITVHTDASISSYML